MQMLGFNVILERHGETPNSNKFTRSGPKLRKSGPDRALLGLEPDAEFLIDAQIRSFDGSNE